MPREAVEQKLAQAANRWAMAPDELRAFVQMVGSSPWARVQEMFKNEERAAEHEMQTGDSLPLITRAQGKSEVIRRVREQIKWIVESYEEAMRDDSE